MFQKSQDPTLVLLLFIWHTIYAWDEALENLYDHICSLVSRVRSWSMECILTCRQESRVITTAEMPITRELHIISAHHLHYMSLLDHYTKHINFIKNTPNPAMESVCEVDRKKSAKLLKRECESLLNEIERLTNELNTQERRLKNVMALVSDTTSVPNLFLNFGDRYSVVLTSMTVGACGIWRQLLFETVPVSHTLSFWCHEYLCKVLSCTFIVHWVL